MKTIKKTKKLKRAVMILSDEGYSDTSESAWYEALQSGKITTAIIYRAMTAYGMRWDAMQGTWYTKARRMPFIKTMFSIVCKIDDRLLKEQGYL
jgi:hypothetical protein